MTARSVRVVPVDDLTSDDEDVLLASDSDDDLSAESSGEDVISSDNDVHDSDQEDEDDEQFTPQSQHTEQSDFMVTSTTGQDRKRRSMLPAAGKALAGEILRRRDDLQDTHGVPVDFLAKVASMLLLRRFDGRVYRGLEVLTLAVPVTSRFIPWGPSKAIGALAGTMVKAVLTTRALTMADIVLDRLMRHLKRGRRRGNSNPRSNAGQEGAGTAGNACPGQVAHAKTVKRRDNESSHMPRAADMAARHEEKMHEMEAMLRQRRVVLPEDRFNSTNAELCRFAASKGLVEGKVDAVQKGTDMVAAMVKWRQSYRFMNMQELSTWGNLVRINGADSNGRPVLVVLLGQALSRLPKKMWPTFVQAIVSNVEYAVIELLGDCGTVAEHIVTVVDVSGCSILHATGAVSLLKEVTSVLSQNYPARLACLYVVDLPRVLKWILQALLPFMHPITRKKLSLKQHGDPSLPVRLNAFKAGTLTAVAGAMEVTPGDDVVPSRSNASGGNQRDIPPLGLPSLNRPAQTTPPRSVNWDVASPSEAAAVDGNHEKTAHRRRKIKLLPRQPSPPAQVEKLTGRMLDLSDLATLLYLAIAIAVCTVLTQQSGIAPRLLKWLQQQDMGPFI